MNILTRLHTIFLLVGPSNCGKSYFCEHFLLPRLEEYKDCFDRHVPFKKFNIQYLSSDHIRKEILGDEYHKYDTQMMYSSEDAFNLLYHKLEIASSYPINAEFIVLDTTGLSEQFREKVLDIAYKNHYNVESIVFNYKERDDYYKYIDKNSEFSGTRTVSNHIRRLRSDVLKNINKRKYSEIHTIKNIDFDGLDITIKNFDRYLENHLCIEKDYIIVGDIHECVDEFKKLMEEFNFDFKDNTSNCYDYTVSYRFESLFEETYQEGKQIILVGDIIDKGNRVKDIIELIYKNIYTVYLVLGNHESFVYKYLKGELDDKSKYDFLLEKFFTAIRVLEKDDSLREKFFKIVEQSHEFLVYKDFIVTHAPCKIKYLGKMDPRSLKKQKNFFLSPDTRSKKDYDDQLRFLEIEAKRNHPTHVFGHIALKKKFRLDNKIGIDTGVIHGNSLTAVIINTNSAPFFKHQNAFKTYVEEDLPKLLERKPKSVVLDSLEDKDLRRLNFLIKYKVNYLSGTMCPADKDIENVDLESLEQAVTYYKNCGVKKLILQPKYMGSRCNVYLYQDIKDCYSVSRRGYGIDNQINIESIYNELLFRFGSEMYQDDIKMILLDGELLPWNLLAKGLIEKQFRLVEHGIHSELNFLSENKFHDHFSSLVAKRDESDYGFDLVKSNKKEMTAKYGEGVYRTYRQLDLVYKSIVPISELNNFYLTYKKQLDLYAEGEGAKFKPFSILKIVYKNGDEDLCTELSNVQKFQRVSDDEYLVIDLDDDNVISLCQTFFDKMTTDRLMEGLVLKPEFDIKGVAPFLKLRNKDYLTIVYGYDYQHSHKYVKLLKEKRIRGKLRASIKEYEIGNKLLATKYSDIQLGNQEYKQLLADMIFEVNKEETFDPRL